MIDSQLIGLWQLTSFEMFDMSGNKECPLGKDPIGYVTYQQSGFMSAHLGLRNRPHIGSVSNLDATPNEAATLVKTYNSYCGRFEVKQQQVYHHIELCMFSNWEGVTLQRTFKVKGNILELSHSLETAAGIKNFIALWKRVV